MKKLITTSIIAVLAVIGSALMAQDEPDEYLGLPGDNLNLYAVMNLFQQSETLEGFERSLNDENSRINNLDLNGDNLIDYLKVVDYVDGDDHTIVLQAVLGRNETQDVAVFTVQRLRDGSVQIQLVGDEILYGRNYIIEPIYAETPNPGYTGNARRNNTTVVRTTYVEVAAWPVVRFIFLPDYVIWRSSWYWGYYPHYWNPWRPYYWHYYYGYHYHWYPDYYRHFHRYDHHRYERWNDFYYHDKRAYSNNVHKRIDAGDYRTTYSRPDQRKEGEKLYSRTHSERQATTSGSTSRRSSGSEASSTRKSSENATGTSRRSSSTTSAGRSRSDQGSTGTTRRSTTTATERKGSNPSGGTSTSTTRRTTTTTTERKESNPPAASQTSTTRRSTTTATERKETSTSSVQNTGTSRRSTATVSERSTNRPETAPRTETSRSTRQPAASGGSSARRSSSTTRSESKSVSTKKESESSTTSRRK